MREEMCAIWRKEGQRDTSISKHRILDQVVYLCEWTVVEHGQVLRTLPGPWRKVRWPWWGSAPAGCHTVWSDGCWWWGHPSALLCTLLVPGGGRSNSGDSLSFTVSFIMLKRIFKCHQPQVSRHKPFQSQPATGSCWLVPHILVSLSVGKQQKQKVITK